MESYAGRGGAPELPQTQLEAAIRAGVKGTGWIDTNDRGTPFQVRTWVDVASEGDAQTLVKNYFISVGGDKLGIVWRDNDYYGLHGVKFEVIRFEAPRLEVMANITGGLNVSPGNAGVIVSGIWTLCPDEIEG